MSKIDLTGSYPLSVYDNEVNMDLQNRVYEFLLDSEYCVNFYDHSHSFWYPRHDEWVHPRNHPSQPRLPMAWDEFSLSHRAPVVHELWLELNRLLDNRFELDGCPEDFPRYMTGISPVSALPNPDGSPGTPGVGWRVYGSGNERELRGRTKSIHRDNPNMSDDQNYGIVYFANREWFPQYYGETLWHSDDPSTGDYTGKFEKDQDRGFPIGDPENMVSVKPGRFFVYDSRYLHQMKPAANYAPQPIMGVVFRVRLKSPELSVV